MEKCKYCGADFDKCAMKYCPKCGKVNFYEEYLIWSKNGVADLDALFQLQKITVKNNLSALVNAFKDDNRWRRRRLKKYNRVLEKAEMLKEKVDSAGSFEEIQTLITEIENKIYYLGDELYGLYYEELVSISIAVNIVSRIQKYGNSIRQVYVHGIQYVYMGGFVKNDILSITQRENVKKEAGLYVIIDEAAKNSEHTRWRCVLF